jgi:hypothetical protein
LLETRNVLIREVETIAGQGRREHELRESFGERDWIRHG